ncbi:MAG: PAS domain S-box protein [Proteobacteria bacterium]|nr:PAS domain S-box protein [Pseudomonadota bacterium]
MMSETPNRAAADLLSEDLLPAAAREAVLQSPFPAIILNSAAIVLFASHAAARRLGQVDGAALMRAGLPRLAPGSQRLAALAQDLPEAARFERLRFVVAHRPTLVPAQASALTLADGTQALLVFFTEGAALTGPVLAEARATQPQDAPPVAAPLPPAPPAVRPSRFVFSLTREGWIDSLSPAFHEALGGHAEMFVGQAMASVAGALDRHAGDAIEKAVAAGTTWGGLRLNWPLPKEGRMVPVVLSAMPLHDAGGLSGFSGFGRVLFDEAMPLMAPSPAPETVATEAAVPAPVVAPELAPADAGEGTAPAAETLVETLPTSSDDLERAILAFAADDAEAIELPQAPQPSLEADEDVHAPEATEICSPAAPAAVDTAVPPQPTPSEDAPDGPEAANVVSLRPGQIDLPAGLPPHLARPGLSMSERNAFREIARALGAKFEPEEGNVQSPPEAAVEAPARPDAPQTPDLFAQAAPPVTEPALEVAAAAPAEEAGEDDEMSLVDALPIGVLVLRGEEPLFANRTLLDLTGYPSLEVFIASGGARALFRKGALPRESEEGFETVVLATREGETLPVDAHLQLVQWDGAPASLIAFRRAVELEQGRALKSVAQDLKRMRSEASELRAVLDTATDGVVTLDETGAILSLNHAAEALFGLHQNEVTGSSFVQLLHNESHAAVLDYFEGLKTNGVRSVLNDGREVAGREKKGGRIPLFLTFGRISDEEPRRYCAVLRDLTAWKRAETELTEARKSAESASAKKSDFLAKVGHEIRTPMNAIIGFAEVMQEERLGPIENPKYKEYLGDIRSSGLHVVSLVNDLLDLSKIEAGRMELNFAATDVNAIVSGCVGLIQPQATQLRVLVRSQLAGKLPPVVADERSIRQIVLNLLSNATRFTPAGGQVLVATVLQESGEAIIRIRDTGVGMSPAEIEQALESYRQVGPRRESGGTGLGLPLSKALAEANRANFSIRSAPGEGTTVEISFPPTRVLAE